MFVCVWQAHIFQSRKKFIAILRLFSPEKFSIIIIIIIVFIPPKDKSLFLKKSLKKAHAFCRRCRRWSFSPLYPLNSLLLVFEREKKINAIRLVVVVVVRLFAHAAFCCKKKVKISSFFFSHFTSVFLLLLLLLLNPKYFCSFQPETKNTLKSSYSFHFVFLFWIYLSRCLKIIIIHHTFGDQNRFLKIIKSNQIFFFHFISKVILFSSFCLGA